MGKKGIFIVLLFLSHTIASQTVTQPPVLFDFEDMEKESKNSIQWERAARILLEDIETIRILSSIPVSAITASGSSNNPTIAMAGFNRLVFWPMLTGSFLSSYNIYNLSQHRALYLSPRENLFITTGIDPINEKNLLSVIEVLDRDTGKRKKWVAFDDAGITSLCLTPDATHLVTGDLNGTVQLWSLEELQPLRSIVEQDWGIIQVSPWFEKSGVVWMDRKGTIQAWDGQETSLLYQPDNQYLYAASAAFSSLSPIAALQTLRTIYFIDYSEGKLLTQIEGSRQGRLFSSVILSADGSYAATLNDANELEIWRVSDGRKLRSYNFFEEDQNYRTLLSSTPDFLILVTIGKSGEGSGQTLGAIYLGPLQPRYEAPDKTNEHWTSFKRAQRSLWRQNYELSSRYFQLAGLSKSGNRTISAHAFGKKDYCASIYYLGKAYIWVFIPIGMGLLLFLLLFIYESPVFNTFVGKLIKSYGKLEENLEKVLKRIQGRHKK